MQTITWMGHQHLISADAMPSSLQEQLGEKALSTYLNLLESVQRSPRSVYTNIKEFASQYPAVPEVINLLTFAHIQNHRIVEAEILIQQTFEAYPQYFFARVNYADQCIRKKKLDQIPAIFPTFDLTELYPEKEVFHTSELRGFFIMLSYYYRAKKEKTQALACLAKAKEIEPHHPSVMYLERKLVKRSLFQRLLRNAK